MIEQAIARPAFAVSLIALAVIAMAMGPNPPALPPAPECTFTVDTPIPIGPEQSTVLLRFSASLGDTLTATFPANAKVVVVSTTHGKNDGPMTATMVLSTLQSTAGLWLVSVRGEKGTCTGKVWVGQGTNAKKTGKK